jgi:hypothetical protein
MGVLSISLALALVFVTPAQAATVEEIIGKYIEATGGQAAHDAIKNRHSQGTFMLVDMGMSASMDQWNAPPQYLSVVSLEGMGEVKSGISDDGTVWEMHFMNGDSIKEGDAAKGIRRQAQLNPYSNYKEMYESVEVEGEEDVDGEACYKVTFTPGDGNPTSVFFSKESGLAIQQVGMGADGMMSTTKIGDYQDVGGVKVPHKLEVLGGMTVEIMFDSIEHNVDIPEGTFATPDAIVALSAPAEEAPAATE